MANVDLSKVMNLADGLEMYKDLRDRINAAGDVKDVTVGGTSVVDENGVAAITLPTVPVTDVQTNGTSILQNGIANIPVAGVGVPGVVMIDATYGISLSSGVLRIGTIPTSDVKYGSNTYKPLTTSRQHLSTFYGLTKAAGVDMAQSSNAVGTYTDEAKQAIQKMLGLDGILGDFENSAIASKAYAIGETFVYNGKRYRATAAIAISDVIAPGTNCELAPISLSDIQINGTSILNNGVANVPLASRNNFGVVKLLSDYGIDITTIGQFAGVPYIAKALTASIKTGTNQYRPIVPYNQHESVYYALAKLAGADMVSASGETVGVYPQAQKTAIQTMLGIEADIPLVETITGATASITGMPNVRYICDTAISELTITPPASGSIVVRFTAGSNCIVSLPQTVKLPAWFDISSLEAGTTYEIIITDGVYGGVMSWA